jgi:predicted nucleotidyltransferase
VYDSNIVRPATQFDLDDDKKELIVTFDKLFIKTDFLKKVDLILKTLQAKIQSPIDIEFACDGTDFYLLQCRPQSFTGDITSDNIPKDIPEEKILFTAKKFISNGRVPEITHIVYVDPVHYSGISDRNRLLQVGRAVGKLNKLLPKRKFILIGPGRWGSRGDIKLGVSVTYSDINNTAMLIEVARKKGNYTPDLSFGTHFFQDLVEANIRYLPLYPDNEGILFNESFFQNSENIIRDLIPEYSHLEDVVKVIDVVNSTDGSILKVMMNADLNIAVGVLTDETGVSESEKIHKGLVESHSGEHWKWRMKIAEKIASELDAEKFGIKAMYVFGSTKNTVAGPGSDINLLVHVDEKEVKLNDLNLWFEGWSLCLSEINFLRTGYKSPGLLDIHYVNDEDIKHKSGFASKIDAVTDAAAPLKLKNNH